MTVISPNSILGMGKVPNQTIDPELVKIEKFESMVSEDPELVKIEKFESMASMEKSNSEIFNYFRLIILCGLYHEKMVSFPLLKELTKIDTAGNLSSHLKAMEKQYLIQYHKGEAGRRILAFYSITEKGRDEAKEAIDKLNKVLDVLK